MANIDKGTYFPTVNTDNLSVGGNAVLSGATFDRMVKVAVVSFTGAQLEAGVRSWANPEGVAVIVGPVLVDVTGNTSGVATMSAGVQSNAVVLSCTVIDNTSINTTSVLNSVDHKGTAGSFARKVPASQYVTFAKASGNATAALVSANCYIHYHIA